MQVALICGVLVVKAISVGEWGSRQFREPCGKTSLYEGRATENKNNHSIIELGAVAGG